MVEIPNVDIRADGGPYVMRTSEMSEIILINIVNKGKIRKEYTLL